MNNLKLSFVSIQRRPCYLYQTLASLYLSGYKDDVHIFPGDLHTQYLECFKENKKINIHPMTQEKWNIIKDWGPERKLNFNWFRSSFDESNYVIMEDDIVFKDDTFDILPQIVNEIEKDGHKNYILQLFHAKNSSNNFLYFKPDEYLGDQCTYYPKHILPILKNYLYQLSIVEGRKVILKTGPRNNHLVDCAGDILKTEICQKLNIEILAVTNSLVQHMGFNSTIGNEPIRSITF